MDRESGLWLSLAGVNASALPAIMIGAVVIVPGSLFGSS
jgi:hypothetical protein